MGWTIWEDGRTKEEERRGIRKKGEKMGKERLKVRIGGIDEINREIKNWVKIARVFRKIKFNRFNFSINLRISFFI